MGGDPLRLYLSLLFTNTVRLSTRICRMKNQILALPESPGFKLTKNQVHRHRIRPLRSGSWPRKTDLSLIHRIKFAPSQKRCSLDRLFSNFIAASIVEHAIHVSASAQSTSILTHDVGRVARIDLHFWLPGHTTNYPLGSSRRNL